MNVPSAREAVELFHLLVVRQLSTGADRTRFTLKGGCNLRFFFGSVRYSEDLDLDVDSIARGTLKNKLDRLLESPGLGLPLNQRGLRVVDVSAPKQTETTQRWKIGLARAGQSMPVRTKIEFSRRERQDTGARTEPIDRRLAQTHGLPPPLVQHYDAPTAMLQKLAALAGRPETQARDVFDLHLLRPQVSALPKLTKQLEAQLPIAIERTIGLSYDDYVSQVVAYVVPDQAAPFGDRAAWDALQGGVVEIFEEWGR